MDKEKIKELALAGFLAGILLPIIFLYLAVLYGLGVYAGITVEELIAPYLWALVLNGIIGAIMIPVLAWVADQIIKG